MISVSLLLAGLLIGAPPQGPGTPAIEALSVPTNSTVSNATKGCGAYCVAIAGRRLGAEEVGFDDTERIVDPDGDGVSTMAEVCRGLASLGIEATAMAGDPDRLPDGLAILHVRSSPGVEHADHFIVSEKLEDGRFRFYVPPVGSGIEDGRRVRGLWQGRFVQVHRPRSWASYALIAGSLAVGLLAGAYLARTRHTRQRSVVEGVPCSVS